jgi:hypothetical protein
MGKEVGFYPHFLFLYRLSLGNLPAPPIVRRSVGSVDIGSPPGVVVIVVPRPVAAVVVGIVPVIFGRVPCAVVVRSLIPVVAPSVIRVSRGLLSIGVS